MVIELTFGQHQVKFANLHELDLFDHFGHQIWPSKICKLVLASVDKLSTCQCWPMYQLKRLKRLKIGFIFYLIFYCKRYNKNSANMINYQQTLRW